MDRSSSATRAPTGSAGRARRAPAASGPPEPTAAQREAVQVFCDSGRAWALREARRSFGHLPDAVREQVVDAELRDLRTRPPAATDRRALATALAERLTESLRDAHTGWALRQMAVAADDAPARPGDGLAAFVESGLAGLERAVLALEIGAGRETRTSRAVLRLRPRQYARHRESGRSKLRDAITGQVVGQACDQHVAGVVAAVMGDDAAMRSLRSGPERCRHCAREAQSLRGALHERLAVAPWPLAIKPAGLVALKLGAVGAALGGKSGGAGLTAALGSSSSSGAGAAATVLAAAALATGGAAIVGHDESPRERTAGHSAAVASPYEADPVTIPAAFGAARKQLAGKSAGAATAARAIRKRLRAQRRARAGTKPRRAAKAPSAPGPTAAPGAPTTAPSAPATSPGPLGPTTKPLTDTLRDTASEITGRLPSSASKPVEDTIDQLTKTVDSLAGTVDDLLSPRRAAAAGGS